MSDDEHYGGGDSGKSTTIPVQCSALRKGQYAMLKGYPCKITEMSTSKTGKHGHAKVHLVGVDIFTGKKCEDLCPSTHKMDTPIVLKKEYQLLGADDGFLTLMDENHNIKDDVRVPTDEKILDELNQILAGDQEHLVSVLSFDKQEQITGFKVKPR